MSTRDTSTLSQMFGEGERAGDASSQSSSSSSPQIIVPQKGEARRDLHDPRHLVEVNYPEPTPLAQVLKDVAKWSGYSFAMEPATNARLQIISARKQTRAEAWELFLVALSVVGLRAIRQGQVVKIVPINLAVSA